MGGGGINKCEKEGGGGLGLDLLMPEQGAVSHCGRQDKVWIIQGKGTEEGVRKRRKE